MSAKLLEDFSSELVFLWLFDVVYDDNPFPRMMLVLTISAGGLGVIDFVAVL